MPRTQEIRPWHAERADAAFAILGASPCGLTEQEASRRQCEYGPNHLPERGPAPLWRIVLRQFASPLIYILVAAAVVSALIGDIKDAGFIAAVLAINAVIGAYQESQAEKSSHALRKLLRILAQVERDGEVGEVKADEVVPGDDAQTGRHRGRRDAVRWLSALGPKLCEVAHALLPSHVAASRDRGGTRFRTAHGLHRFVTVPELTARNSISDLINHHLERCPTQGDVDRRCCDEYPGSLQQLARPD
jgi:hypothetical protein